MSDLRQLVSSIMYPRDPIVLTSYEAVIDKYVIGSCPPENPPLKTGTPTACIGSCFADEMAKSLAAQGRPVVPVFLSERWSSAFAVRHYLEFCLEDRPFPDGFLPAGLNIHAGVAAKLRAAEAFIITLGLSACWFETASGRMVMDVKGGHTKGGLSAALGSHRMRQTSVAENVAQIAGIVACIRQSRTGAPIVFTLSPVPLLASATDDPPVVSNTISKAALRMALHEVMAQQPQDVFYWPSYEIVEWVGKYVRPIWGQDGLDLRHLQPELVDWIMQRFCTRYFASASEAPLPTAAP